MLRLTEVERNGGTVTLRVEGSLAAEWSGVLESQCNGIIDRGACVRLVLSDVHFVDRAGAETLLRLRRSRAELLDCSPVLLDYLEEIAP